MSTDKFIDACRTGNLKIAQQLQLLNNCTDYEHVKMDN